MALTQKLLAARFVGPIVYTIFKECLLGPKTGRIAVGMFELAIHSALCSKDTKSQASKRYVHTLRLRAASEHSWYSILDGGCLGGHVDIVNMAITKGAQTYNSGLYYACRGGHRQIAHIMISKGACNLNYALQGACEENQREMA
jgi:hypothetical protein